MDCSPTSERKALKCVGYLPVVLCFALIAWSYYAFVPSLCVPMLNERPIQAVFYLVIYHFLLIMFVWSYIQILATHPGTPADCAVRAGGGGRGGTPGFQNSVRSQEDSQTTSVGEGSHLIHTEVQNVNEDGLIRNRPTATDTSSEQQNSPVVPVGSPATSSNFMELDTRQRIIPVENVDVSVTVKRNGDQRFCTKCSFEKYDRAHHCRICKQCILKMDHHCPWINGCVGFRNQKFFILFISWGAIYCMFLAFATVPAFIHALQSDEGILTFDLHWAFLILAGGLFGICLLAFATFHGGMVLSNRTTIESFQRHNYRSQGGLAPARHLNLFDVGKKKNFVQVMGEPWYLWFVPIGNSLGDGYTYPLNNESYSALAVGFGDRRIDRPSPSR